MFNQELFILRLTSLRKANNLSQLELGQIVNLSKQAINEIEKGRTTTRIEKLVLLADYFDVSTDYLLGLTEIKKIATQKSFTQDLQDLIMLYSKLQNDDKEKIIEMTRTLVNMGSTSEIVTKKDTA